MNPQASRENPLVQDVRPVMSSAIPVAEAPASQEAPTSLKSGSISAHSPVPTPTPSAQAQPSLNHTRPHPKSGRHFRLQPWLPAAVALIVAVGLSAAAVYAFKASNKVPPANAQQTSSQTQAKLTGQDLDTLSQNIQTQINNLNDSQDFNAAALSDQTLGLN